jgi:hypothetical protein
LVTTGFSDKVKPFVIDRLVLSVSPTAIIQQWRRHMHEQYAEAHGLPSAQAAERAMNQVCHLLTIEN